MARRPASADRQIELFLDMIAAERGAGANTLSAYERDLRDFSAFLKEKGVAIAAAGTDDLRAYLGRLAARGYKGA